MSAETECTYFWAVTMTFPTERGLGTFSAAKTFEATGAVSRADTLRQVREYALAHGVPHTANITFFTVEPDQLAAPPAVSAAVASALAEVRAALDDDSADRTYVLESVERQLAALEVTR